MNTTVTAITSSPSDFAAEMPSAVSLDMPDTGTITSDARLTGCGGTCPIASSTPIRAYARATAMNISTSSGMTIATSHAPARNLLTSSMIVAANVSTAPTPLMQAL